MRKTLVGLATVATVLIGPAAVAANAQSSSPAVVTNRVETNDDKDDSDFPWGLLGLLGLAGLIPRKKKDTHVTNVSHERIGDPKRDTGYGGSTH